MAPIGAVIAPILKILPIAKAAFDTIAEFLNKNGDDSKLAKATDYIQDAMAVLGQLVPLIQQHGKGQEVTQRDVDLALNNMSGAIARLDQMIAMKKEKQPNQMNEVDERVPPIEEVRENAKKPYTSR